MAACAPMVALMSAAAGAGGLAGTVGGLLGATGLAGQVLGGAVVGLVTSGGKGKGAVLGGIMSGLGALASGAAASPAASLAEDASKTGDMAKAMATGVTESPTMATEPMKESVFTPGARADMDFNDVTASERFVSGGNPMQEAFRRSELSQPAAGGVLAAQMQPQTRNFLDKIGELSKNRAVAGAVAGVGKYMGDKALLQDRAKIQSRLEEEAYQRGNRAFAGMGTSVPFGPIGQQLALRK